MRTACTTRSRYGPKSTPWVSLSTSSGPIFSARAARACSVTAAIASIACAATPRSDSARGLLNRRAGRHRSAKSAGKFRRRRSLAGRGQLGIFKRIRRLHLRHLLSLRLLLLLLRLLLLRCRLPLLLRRRVPRLLRRRRLHLRRTRALQLFQRLLVERGMPAHRRCGSCPTTHRSWAQPSAPSACRAAGRDTSSADCASCLPAWSAPCPCMPGKIFGDSAEGSPPSGERPPRSRTLRACASAPDHPPAAISRCGVRSSVTDLRWLPKAQSGCLRWKEKVVGSGGVRIEAIRLDQVRLEFKYIRRPLTL